MLAFLEQTINILIELAILAGGGAFLYALFLLKNRISTTGKVDDQDDLFGFYNSQTGKVDNGLKSGGMYFDEPDDWW